MPIPTKIIMYDDNTAQVKATGLKDEGTGTFFDNTAQVTATLYDSQGNTVQGCINVVMSYVANSNGDFTGRVDQAFSPPLGGGYRLHVTATQGSAQGNWKIPVEVQTRATQ